MKLLNWTLILLAATLAFQDVCRAGTVLEDVVNFGSLGYYDREKKKREAEAREKAEAEARRLQAELAAQEHQQKEEHNNKIRQEIAVIRNEIQSADESLNRLIRLQSELAAAILNLSQETNQVDLALQNTVQVQDRMREWFELALQRNHAGQRGEAWLASDAELFQLSTDTNLSIQDLLQMAGSQMQATKLLLVKLSLDSEISVIHEIRANYQNTIHELEKSIQPL